MRYHYATCLALFSIGLYVVGRSLPILIGDLVISVPWHWLAMEGPQAVPDFVFMMFRIGGSRLVALVLGLVLVIASRRESHFLIHRFGLLPEFGGGD